MALTNIVGLVLEKKYFSDLLIEAALTATGIQTSLGMVKYWVSQPITESHISWFSDRVKVRFIHKNEVGPMEFVD